MAAKREVLEFSDLAPYLLLKNGNFLYKVPFRGGQAVLKVYYDSRGTIERWEKSVSNWLSGQTSYLPSSRCKVERECLALWKANGIRVPEVYDVELKAPGCKEGYYLLIEFIPHGKLIDWMTDEKKSADERFAMWRRFLPEWSKRHEMAIAQREPRLVHENGDCKHVMLMPDGGFLFFDLEMVYRSRARIEEHVGHEVLQYLWHTSKSMEATLRDRLLDETIAHYPRPERLRQAALYLVRHPRIVPRGLRALERVLRSQKLAKPTSKLAIAKRILERLDRR
jgi:hypothetical protein